ncbi:MAG: sulfotransferase family protein [Bacillota bacterium]
MVEESKLFLVLSLHRAGSSATAGVLHHLGIHMGDDLMGPHEFNPKGHFESLKFVAINDHILALLGGAWNRPVNREKVAHFHYPEVNIRSFLSIQKKPVWGLKDPRTLITFEIWKPYLEEISSVTYIFIHRPFNASASSLARREGIDLNKAREILSPYLTNLNYYRSILYMGKKDIIDVSYDDLLKKPEVFVSKINQRIGQIREHNIDKVKSFLDERLRHF